METLRTGTSKVSKNRNGARVKGCKKTGGRTKGVPNRKNQEVRDMLAKLNCNPIEAMARIAMDDRTLESNESLKSIKAIKKLLKGKKELSNFLDMLLASFQKHPPELRAKMFSELAQYIHAKRKAVELSGADGDTLAIEVIKRVIVNK